jgi:cyclophilin family peptidyl-prolyl cis-trans isomerase
MVRPALTLLGLLMASTAATAANPQVVIETSLGTITVELYEDKAPITVKNFLQYTDDKHYDGTIFHRVIDGFMVQGGGLTPDMKQKDTRDPIKNEAANGVTNDKYTLAMARTSDINSATSQFFINVKDNDFLNHRGPAQFGYCAFGKVVSGTDVVDKIKAVPTGRKGGMDDVPTETVIIKSVKRK